MTFCAGNVFFCSFGIFGGGNGDYNSGKNGIIGTGGGGGGSGEGCYGSCAFKCCGGGNGGNGVVIIRYA